MKIALIQAASRYDPLIKLEPFMPLSLPLLAACAPEHDYTFISMLDGDKIDFKKNYDLVGISYRITAEKTAFEIAEEFKKKYIPVVMGGPQASTTPLNAIKHSDCVVVGEGEELWPVLLKDLQNNKLKHFYVSSPEKFVAKKHTIYQIKSFLDLKKVPAAKRELYKKKYPFDTLFASRGCPINCDFCSVPYLYGKKVRFRPIKNVVDEIKTFKNFYYLLDDNVFGRKNCYEYYLKLYEEISGLQKIKYWTGQASLDAVLDKDGQKVIKKAAGAGLAYVSVGMESINPVVLKKSGVIKKIGTKKSKDVISVMKESIRFIQDQGIIVSGWFAIGYEEDSIDTYYKTMDFCIENNVIPVINSLEALPGTKLYERLKKAHRITDKKSINIIHPRMKDEEVFKALKEINSYGYSTGNILKRTLFYIDKFGKNKKNNFEKVYDIIFRTVFSLILNSKVKKGLISYTNNETFFG